MSSTVLRAIYPILVICAAFCCLSMTAVGAAPDLYHFRPGVHLSQDQPLTARQLKTLLNGLRSWTGLTEIDINSRGDLTLGNRAQITGGSKIARELIIAAVDSPDSFTLANSYDSPAVSFAQIQATDRYVNGSGVRLNGWQLRIDFFDFAQLRGDEQALHAFDPAITVLHELVHGVFGYFDPLDSRDGLGECERYINRIRVEMGRPERRNYYPEKRYVRSPESVTQILQAEFTFMGTDEITAKPKEFLISFNLERVFDVSKARSKAANQADLRAQKLSAQ